MHNSKIDVTNKDWLHFLASIQHESALKLLSPKLSHDFWADHNEGIQFQVSGTVTRWK